VSAEIDPSIPYAMLWSVDSSDAATPCDIHVGDAPLLLAERSTTRLDLPAGVGLDLPAARAPAARSVRASTSANDATISATAHVRLAAPSAVTTHASTFLVGPGPAELNVLPG